MGIQSGTIDGYSTRPLAQWSSAVMWRLDFVRINALGSFPAFSLIVVLIVQSMLLNFISHLAFIVLPNA